MFLYVSGSDSYKFIHVEEYGYVTSYAPRVSSGDHQHLLFVRGESEIEVPLPVSPQIQQGTITVQIDLSTQIMSSTQSVSIKVLPEGSIVHRHTSSLIDLKSRAKVLK